MKYKVRFSMDDNYQVIEMIPNTDYDEDDHDSEEYNECIVYHGKLSDCEAYIRLTEQGYM